MTQTIYNTFQGINTEIVTVGTLLETADYTDGGGRPNGDEDLFQCGKCKKQFHSFGTFLLHKKTHQLCNVSVSQSLVSDVGSEADLQFQPIILSESDILSFNISQTELNLSNTDEVASEEPIEGLVLPVTNLLSSSMYSISQPITYLDKDQVVITENEIEYEDIQKDDEENEESKRKALQRIKEAKLKCPYCLKQFTKLFDLQQHLRVHTGERPFQCIVCGRSFTQKSNIKKHMATHKSWPHGIRTLPEKPIQRIPTSTSGETVVVDESFVCQYCPSSFSSFVQLKAHRKTHVNNKIFKCVQKNCYAVFEALDKFLEHTAAHQEDSNSQYRCFHCRQPFHSLDDLNNHQRMHVPCRKKKQSALLCKLCKSKFFSVEALERHHVEDPHSYPCSECNKVYVSERHLRRHLRTHSSVLAFTCPECSKSFKTAQSLSLHKLVHSSERPFACKFCPATFTRHDRLIRHTFIHDSNRRYKCPFSKHVGCKMEFYRKDKLKQHLLTHSSNKTLKCLRCNRMFKRSSQLRRHETICLSEDKPCKDCGHVTTSLDHYKKNTTVSKEHSHVNRRKSRLLEASKKSDDGVPTIQVVVVPLSGADGEQVANEPDS